MNILALLFLAQFAHADITDSGALLIGSNAIVQGTMTVQGNQFSVGGSTFAIVGSSVGVRTTTPAYALDVNGQQRVASQLIVQGTMTIQGQDSSGYSLKVSSSIQAQCLNLQNGQLCGPGGSVTGTGAAGASARFTGTSAVGNGAFTDNAATVTAPSGTAFVLDAGATMTVSGRLKVLAAAPTGASAVDVLYDSNFDKMWAVIGSTTGTPIVYDSFNLSSVTSNGVGDVTFSFGTSFATESLPCVCMVSDGTAHGDLFCTRLYVSSSSLIRIRVFQNLTATNEDAVRWSLRCSGRQ